MNLRELRSCYETAFDTRNHGLRQSAKYSKGKIELYSERYNYIQPERNEYFYGEIIDGTFIFTIQKKVDLWNVTFQLMISKVLSV